MMYFFLMCHYLLIVFSRYVFSRVHESVNITDFTFCLIFGMFAISMFSDFQVFQKMFDNRGNRENHGNAKYIKTKYER